MRGPTIVSKPPRCTTELQLTATTPPLSLKETLLCLEDWATHQKALTKPLDQLQALTGAMPDCALLEPIYSVWNVYTKMVSEKVGDAGNWLSYFEFDCEMGAKPKEVFWTGLGGKQISVKMSSLNQLARVIKS